MKTYIHSKKWRHRNRFVTLAEYPQKTIVYTEDENLSPDSKMEVSEELCAGCGHCIELK